MKLCGDRSGIIDGKKWSCHLIPGHSGLHHAAGREWKSTPVKGATIGEFRKRDFSLPSMTCNGAYVQVYMRPGEKPLVDMNYFDGNPRTLSQARGFRTILDRAIKQGEAWEKHVKMLVGAELAKRKTNADDA